MKNIGLVCGLLVTICYGLKASGKYCFRKNAHANFYRRSRCGKKVSTAKSGNEKTE